MKTRAFTSKLRVSALLLGLALFIGACGQAAQQKIYEHAAKMEEQFTAENAPAIIAEYKRVIAMEPDTGWATKARGRIEAVEARVRAEEHRKNVFQEHGID